MEEGETRKIQFTGKSSYIISLPKQWVIELGLKQGDQIRIVRKGPSTFALLLLLQFFFDWDLICHFFGLTLIVLNPKKYREINFLTIEDASSSIPISIIASSFFWIRDSNFGG